MAASDAIALHTETAEPQPDQATPAKRRRTKPAAPTLAAEQIGARDASALSGVSTPTWWRLHAAGKVPSPVKLGGRTLWRVAELRAWIGAGCPGRDEWQARRAAEGGRR